MAVRKLGILWWLMCLAVVFHAGPSMADQAGTSPQDALGHAEKLAEEGIEHYKKGEYELAVEKFSAAQEIVPSAPNLYNIARSLDNMGRYKEAAVYYEKYINEGGEKAGKATSYLETIKARPSPVHVKSIPTGADVFVDDGVESAGQTPVEIALSPGKHMIGVGLLGHSGSWKEVDVPFLEEISVVFHLDKTGEGPETTLAAPSPGTGPEVLVPSLDAPEKPGVMLEAEGVKARVTNLFLVGGGLTVPIKFDEIGISGNVAATWSIGVRGGLDIGLGFDGFISTGSRLWSVYAHVGFVARFKHRFFVHGRLGVGGLILKILSGGSRGDVGVYGDMFLRGELGIGWELGGFNIRITPVCFALNLGLDDASTGPTGLYFPLVWLGYRF